VAGLKPRSLVDDVADALGPILAKGLPISPDYDDERLLGLSCVLERCLDPTDRLNRVKVADELLREVIAAYPSDDMGHAVRLLFGVASGSRGGTLGKRRGLALGASKLNDERHFRKNIVPKIVRTLAWQIVQRTLEPRPSRVLSSEMSENARQLYRYAQRALVLLEAFDLCAKFAVRLRVFLIGARLGELHPDQITTDWLTIYGYDDSAVQLVPASRTMEGDRGLWALAYCHRYLRTLLRDRDGRDYVREGLPPETWESLQRYPAFKSEDTDRLISALGEGGIDSPSAFVQRLCSDTQGRAIHEYWLELLNAQSAEPGDMPFALTRTTTIRHLLELCIALQHRFAEETLAAPAEDFEDAVVSLVIQRTRELGVTDGAGDEIRAASQHLQDAILDYAPPRYEVAMKESRDSVWNDEPSSPDVWDGLVVTQVWLMLTGWVNPERLARETRVVLMPGSPMLKREDVEE
jgi:hypothetical protein